MTTATMRRPFSQEDLSLAQMLRAQGMGFRAIARQMERDHQTIRKWLGPEDEETRMGVRLAKEEIVERVLNAPAEVTAAELGRQCGMSREAIRKIRLGQLYGDVLPHLARFGHYVASRRCWQCQMGKHDMNPKQREAALKRAAKAAERDCTARNREEQSPDQDLDPRWCSLGIPESVNGAFARECPLFEPVT